MHNPGIIAPRLCLASDYMLLSNVFTFRERSTTSVALGHDDDGEESRRIFVPVYSMIGFWWSQVARPHPRVHQSQKRIDARVVLCNWKLDLNWNRPIVVLPSIRHSRLDGVRNRELVGVCVK